ncbi:hypothetical protein [Xylophilus sp. GOD-11R]|uniref:hypothetical protein n=1 Tax=Xylophilus sp. GOD-11R TaxID=3089814 RepID=UPI00298C5BED|nr:hypothetical protein [Xylophilus sp. GOD-11R]WPB55363.1 hypothetical protein R9X41_14555 [Xylophilus sp. GOD-11R]
MSHSIILFGDSGDPSDSDDPSDSGDRSDVRVIHGSPHRPVAVRAPAREAGRPVRPAPCAGGASHGAKPAAERYEPMAAPDRRLPRSGCAPVVPAGTFWG